MDQDCEVMFNERKKDELKFLYIIITDFKRVDTTIKHFIDKMNAFIEKEGEKIVLSADLKTKPLEMVSKLLEFKNEIDELITVSFFNDMRF